MVQEPAGRGCRRWWRLEKNAPFYVVQRSRAFAPPLPPSGRVFLFVKSLRCAVDVAAAAAAAAAANMGGGVGLSGVSMVLAS